jgi:hypothetical protein
VNPWRLVQEVVLQPGLDRQADLVAALSKQGSGQEPLRLGVVVVDLELRPVGLLGGRPVVCVVGDQARLERTDSSHPAPQEPAQEHPAAQDHDAQHAGNLSTGLHPDARHPSAPG